MPGDKHDNPPLSRTDIETIMRIDREHAERLLRLKQAILDGDAPLEHQIARELVGLPREPTAQTPRNPDLRG